MWNERLLAVLSVLWITACSSRSLRSPGSGLQAPGGGSQMRDAGSTNSPDGASIHDMTTIPDQRPPADMVAGPDLWSAADLSTGTPSSAPCLTGGSIIYFDGDLGDYIHPGVETIYATDSRNWLAGDVGEKDTFEQGWAGSPNDWYFSFSSRQLNEPLRIQRYDGAQRYPFEEAGHPGLDITGAGRGCNMSSGWFQIESLAGGPNSGSFTELTVIFEQHCENGTAALRGCLHYENTRTWP
jgi:hypothetical protein